MKIFILMLGLISLLMSCGNTMQVAEIEHFAAKENYPEDLFLDTVKHKKALVVVAHDDDDGPMAGTIALLTSRGWEIRQVCLEQHPDKKTGKNPSELICAGSDLLTVEGGYRTGMDTMKMPYLPVSYEAIEQQYHTAKVAELLTPYINSFNPSVLFTLDDWKGGYGHPDHVFISKLVLQLHEENKISPSRIYQAVYTDHMEREIVYKWLTAKMDALGYPNPSILANQLYAIEGMPEPDVQIAIQDVAVTKMTYLRAYGEDVRKNLRKFIPYFEAYPADTYFQVFDREFFRVIE